MAILPPPYCLKAVELGLVDPEAVIPREWIYDFCVLAPASPEDCVAFFRNYGATTEVDDNTYLALIAGGFFQNRLSGNDVTRLLAKRFSHQTASDSGVRGCLNQLIDAQLDPHRTRFICATLLLPYLELAQRLLADLPAPDEFTCWNIGEDAPKNLRNTHPVAP
jgi:hypothetical protein